MGANGGNGAGGANEMAGAQGNGSGHPPATEYTLQGVMRFLQTEWHRHERDRNSWEIERQEMKGRIAMLEGQARRADATQKTLKKYVAILEKKVKEQGALLKADKAGADEAVKSDKVDRAAAIQEKLRSSAPKQSEDGEDLGIEKTDEESQRAELKLFLDQCQTEFTYLMITPANPPPPRDSPPLPSMEEGEGFGPQGGQGLEQAFSQQVRQNHVRDLNARPAPALNHAPPPPHPSQLQNLQNKNAEGQAPPMIRSTAQTQPTAGSVAEHPPSAYTNAQDWHRPLSVSAKVAEATETLAQLNHAAESYEGAPGSEEADRRMVDPDSWDFPEGAYPPPNAALPQASNRPDTDVFPSADNLPKSPSRGPPSHRRKGSMSRRRSADHELSLNSLAQKTESGNFKLAFGLRGHLNTVRTVIFSGGGSPGEPEICTAGDDGMIKRFHIPRFDAHSSVASDLDIVANFTHRGHNGPVLSLTSWSPSPNFSTGGRAQGDGWIFSGGQDASIRVWERGRVDPKATIDGHTDAVWAVCVLPGTLGTVFGATTQYGSADRILLVSGAADGTVRVWSVSAPPQLTSPQPGSNRRGGPAGGGRVRGNSMSSGSAFPNSPQPNMASNSPFNHNLVHTITRADRSQASPTSITPLANSGESFVVSYSDAAILVFDTRTGEEIGTMASLETYDGTIETSVNAVVATTAGLDQGHVHPPGGLTEEETASSSGPTGGGRSMAGSGVEGVIISGHEDRFVRFFDANSGQCTYNMLAHPAAISSLSLSPDGRELVSAGHDASLRFWSLEKRSCTQEITSHRIMRGEGVCSVVWSQDGKFVVSAGGDGVAKVFSRL